VGGIYRTDDLNDLAGSAWIKLPNPPRTEGHPAAIVVLNDGKVVCTFSGRINPSGAFTASSGVFLYDPLLNSWTDVSDNGMLYWTQDIIIDPGDAAQNTWYVCVYSGWGGAPNGLGGLYKTTNRGTSWTKLTDSQFDRVTSITFNPQSLTQAYLTTETQGLWVLNNLNNTTPASTLVSSYPFRQPERVFFNPYDPNEVWVTSFGNGMKIGNLNPTGIASFSGKKSDDIVIYPNPNKGVFAVNVENKGSSEAVVEIINMMGEQIFSEKRMLKTGERILQFSIKNTLKGIFLLKIKTAERVSLSKLMID